MREVEWQPHIENKCKIISSDLHKLIVNSRSVALNIPFGVFQIAELCLLFALTKGICCFEARAVDNSG